MHEKQKYIIQRIKQYRILCTAAPAESYEEYTTYKFQMKKYAVLYVYAFGKCIVGSESSLVIIILIKLKKCKKTKKSHLIYL